MQDIDLNLLTALGALLQTGSVAKAARKLGLSASAMSRTLGRLRAATGDPLLVRAGRGLVPTPHAEALRTRVRDLAREVEIVLRPGRAGLDLATQDRVFTLRANEGFIEAFAMRIVTAVITAAPAVRLRFAPKPDKDVRPLREGLIDLEIGVLGETGPEVRVQALFHDRFVAVVHSAPLNGGAGDARELCRLRPCGDLAPGCDERAGGSRACETWFVAADRRDRAEFSGGFDPGAGIGSGGAGAGLVYRGRA